MKKYKVENNKLIQEEITEIPITNLDNKIRRIEREIEMARTRIARYEEEIAEYEAELKDLKKLAGGMKNV